MKQYLFLPLLAIVLFLSCTGPSGRNENNDTPAALEDNKSSFEIVSKRSHEDMVESLYRELITKDTLLKKLEDLIDYINESRLESAESFNDFNGKNQAYFNSANRHLENIKDSVLKEKIKTMITTQVTKYTAQTSVHTNLLNTIENKSVTILDMYTALKIVKTLPLIDKFQKEKLPDTNPLKDFINQQENAILIADTLIKK